MILKKIWHTYLINSKILILIMAVSLALFSWIYTNKLVKRLKIEEANKVELWGDAYKDIVSTDITEKVNFLSFKIIRDNKTIPVIMVNNEGKIISYANLDSTKADKENYLNNQLKKFMKNNKVIEINYSENSKTHIYYDESVILKMLKNYPYIQALFIFVFLIIVYLLVLYFQKAEDNLAWVSISKETAHQLGTPISSLLGWIELIKSKDENDEIIIEVEKDVRRLELITERFSKIGMPPHLTNSNIISIINNSIEYLKPRTPSKIIFDIISIDNDLEIMLNPLLFQWVIENLCKNSIDAMDGKGRITIIIRTKSNGVMIDVSDTGKGMTKKEQKKAFKQGFTTKKYGWGFGLPLAKRIIEEYHNGKLYILKSNVGKGTTFRIELNN